MLLAQLAQRGHRNGDGLRRFAELRLRRAGVVFDHGREAVEIVDEIEGGSARGLAPTSSFDVAVARPYRPA